ncbi:MAG TPA: hypothetical protein VMV55_00700 [Methanoregula sp.]|nr:hypothetical protein [Methanoregula sp.]
MVLFLCGDTIPARISLQAPSTVLLRVAVRAGTATLLLLYAGRGDVPEGLVCMVVVRPPNESYILPPGLGEESFDADTRPGRVNLLSILFTVVSTINRKNEEIADLLLILSGPVTYFYRPGGGIAWEEIREVLIHPLNLKNVGFRYDWGSLRLTKPLMNALTKELELSGFTLKTGPSSVTVRELGNTRITLYNPVEIGFSASLWDILDPGTSIYLGSQKNLKRLQGMIAFLPDKRTTLAVQFINDAKRYAASGDFRYACRPLAGAAQVLGRIRLWGEILQAFGKNRLGTRTFDRFFHELETARGMIDALWRYQAGNGRKLPGTVPLEPVSISIGELEVGEFTALIRDLGIVCIARKTGDAVTISFDKHDLEQKAGELGMGQLPQFSLFFEEVTGPDLPEANRDQLIRIQDTGGTVRYYDLRKE